MRAPNRRTLAISAMVALVVGATSPVMPVHASPSLETAKERALALNAEVRALEVKAEIATERYNEASAELQDIVNRYVLAERTSDAAANDARSTAGISDDRVRAVYMAGGQAALFASVLDSGDITEVIDRVGTVDALVNSDRVRTDAAVERAAKAEQASDDLDDLALQRTKVQKKVSDARNEVTQLLTQRQAELSSANAEVIHIAEQLERERQAREEAAARTRLAQLNLLQNGTLNGNEGALATPYAARAIVAARSQLGDPYLWGGTGPDAWDCSGLVQWAYRQAGVNLDRTSRQQWHNGPKIALKDLRAGDLIFWAWDTADPATIHHVAMYSGNGRMIEAPRTGLNVREIPVYLDGYIGAVRPGAST